MKSKTVNIFGSNSTDNINTTFLALNSKFEPWTYRCFKDCHNVKQ